ncbi:MAG: hypothetical protein ACM3ON_11840 [Chloroflexota bacterium]
MSPLDPRYFASSQFDECVDKELLEDMMVSHTLMRMFIRSKGLCSEFLSWRLKIIEGKKNN